MNEAMILLWRLLQLMIWLPSCRYDFIRMICAPLTTCQAGKLAGPLPYKLLKMICTQEQCDVHPNSGFSEFCSWLFMYNLADFPDQAV